MIYFLEADDGPIKIGVSTKKNFSHRFYSIQLDNHHHLELIRVIRGYYIAEKWIHNYFKDKGVWRRGEWFDYHPDMNIIEAPEHLLKEKRRARVLVSPRTCPVCNDIFKPPTNTTKQIYCSLECYRNRYMALCDEA